MPKLFKVGGERIAPGETKIVNIHIASLYDYTELNMPVKVIRSKEPGPKLFISAAIHGDEINGVEVIRRLLKKKVIKKIKGTLIVVPIVNVFGFNNKSRYLPDRRDLNRSFPGSKDGSLASRLAHCFMTEVVANCTHGIDMHTGAQNRYNLPQIRACLDDQQTKELSLAFGVPVVLDSKLRDSSMREAALKKKKTILLYEGGEALRFNEEAIRRGVDGCLRVMSKIGMLPENAEKPQKGHLAYISRVTKWVRAPHSGLVRMVKKTGDSVREGEKVGFVYGPLDRQEYPILSDVSGIIIGLSTIPLVNQGDAIFHVATFTDSAKVKRAIERLDLDY